MVGQPDLVGVAIGLVGAWTASVATAVADGGAVGAVTLAFSGALTMLYVGQRRQRQMLLESIELARTDRDQCRAELSELKLWLGDSPLDRRNDPR